MSGIEYLFGGRGSIPFDAITEGQDEASVSVKLSADPENGFPACTAHLKLTRQEHGKPKTELEIITAAGAPATPAVAEGTPVTAPGLLQIAGPFQFLRADVTAFTSGAAVAIVDGQGYGSQ